MISILFVGPLPPPVHGQSIAFEEAWLNIGAKKYVVDQNFESQPFFKKIFSTCIALIKTTYFVFFKKIDVVYFTSSRSKFGSLKDIYLLFLSNVFNIKVVNHLHGADLDAFYNNLPSSYKKIIDWGYSKIDVSIVLLPKMKGQFLNNWPNMKVEVIPNFFSNDLNHINKKIANQKIELLYLSNIMVSKGIFDLLRAIEMLDDAFISYHLTIAGSFINDMNMTSASVEKKFMNKIHNNMNITYIGVVKGEIKVNILERSDIFILPTFYITEAFPISILEAMRAGNVIITTNHNYLPEIINENMGELVAIKSPQMIYEAINKYIANREKLKKVQNYNIEYAKKHYSANNYINQLMDVFMRVLNK